MRVTATKKSLIWERRTVNGIARITLVPELPKAPAKDTAGGATAVDAVKAKIDGLLLEARETADRYNAWTS